MHPKINRGENKYQIQKVANELRFFTVSEKHLSLLTKKLYMFTLPNSFWKIIIKVYVHVTVTLDCAFQLDLLS